MINKRPRTTAALLLAAVTGIAPVAGEPSETAYEHPRLLFPKSEEPIVRKRIQADPLAAKLYRELLRRADRAIDLPVCRHEIPDGKRLLRQSRHALSNILHTSMAWRLSDEKKYLRRAVKELDAATAMKDWNPSHFLDTAEMSTAVAIGYDWLYHGLTPEQRTRYAAALRTKGLAPARAAFTGEERPWWTTPRNNWAQVCSAGLLISERALENPGDPLHPARLKASKTLAACRKFYQPSGAYPEGPAYWHYGSNYHVLGIATVRESPAELQIAIPPEFEASPLFAEHLSGPTGKVFNFADAGPGTSTITAAQSWMAREFADPATCRFIRGRLARDIRSRKNHPTSGTARFFPLHLLWLPPALAAPAPPLPLDSLWHGSQPVATFRSSWEDPDALYFAMKGGYPGASHGQMDVGAFIMECDGIRWAEDLGKDNYNMPGYFGSKRWSYFRLTNLSHSTLVIGGRLQNKNAKPSTITCFTSRKNGAGCDIDLTPAYSGQAEKITRHCRFDRKKGRVTLVDSIREPEGDVRWAMVTSAEIEINGRHAILKKAGKRLMLTRNDKHGGKWTVQDAKPDTDMEKQNKGVRILTFTAPAARKLKLSVSMERP